MDLEEIIKKEQVKEPQKGLNVLWQLYNKGLGEIPWEIFNSTSMFLSSQEYRTEIVKNYIMGRINKAEQKGRIKTSKVNYLYGHLDKEKISPYLFDFFMHTIGLNAAGVGLGCYFVYMPFLSGDAGYLKSFITAGILGSITRTVWTAGRISCDCLRKENKKDKTSIKEKIKSAFEKRSVALGIGIIPYLGGLFGYPTQMIYSEYKKDRELGDFILDDSLYGIEKKIPAIRRVRKKIINKIYKDLMHVDIYGTNKNNRDKRVR